MNPYKIIICCFIIYFHFGKSHRVHAQSYNFESYTVDHGLSQNSIYDLHIDKEGFLWVATADGLNKFDGYSFEKYKGLVGDSCSLKNNFIRRIVETASGNFILQTDQGIEYFDKQKKCFKNLLNIDQMRYLKLSAVMIGGDDSVVWAYGTLGFVLKIEIATLTYTKFKVNQKSMGLYSYHGLMKVGNHLLLLLENRLIEFNIQTKVLTHVFERKSKSKCNLSLIGDEVFFIDSNNLVSYQINSNKIRKTEIKGFDAYQAFFIHMKNKREGYITNKYNEIVYFKDYKVVDLIKNTALNYRSLTTNFLNVILVDAHDNLWVGSDGAGVQKSNKLLNNISHYTLNENRLNNKVMVKSFAELDSNKVLVGTFGYGVYTFNPARDEYIVPFNCKKFKQIDVYALRRIGDKVLIGTQTGLMWYDIKKNILEKPKYFNTDSRITYIELYQNKLYISSDSGFFISDIQLKAVTQVSRKENGYYVYTMHDSKGALWRTNVYTGIFYEKDGFKTTITTKDGLLNESVRCVVEDLKGNYWAATEGGLAYIKFDGKNKPQIINYTEKNGLANSYIYAIILTQDNNLWLSTNAGLTYFDTHTKKCTNYTPKDGLQSNEFNTGAYLMLSNKTLCFGGVNGFNIIQDDFRFKEKVTSPIVVTYFQAGDSVFKHVKNNEVFYLDYLNNHIQINFAYLNYTNVSKNIFAYRLLGMSDEWHYLGHNNQLNLSALEPGSYQLQLRAAFNDEQWSNQVFTMRIIITPPWFKTWWFYSLFLLVVLTIFFYIFYLISTNRLRKRIALIERQKEIEKIRSRISSDIHDDIGAGLSKITLFSQVAQSQINNPMEMKAKLEKIGDDSRDLINNLREIVWAMDPENDSLKSLLAYIREYATNYFDQTNVILNIHFDDQAYEILVFPDFKRNIFMIVKEALSNILKYAHCDQVELSFKLDGMQYEFLIEDDGVGIDQAKMRKFSNGMSLMKKRAEEIQATFELATMIDRGTKISIRGSFEQ